MPRFPLLCLLLAACGLPESSEGVHYQQPLSQLHSAPLEAQRPSYSEGFDSWTANAPPDGWALEAPARWNELLHRAQEAHQGEGALFASSCQLEEPRFGGCERNTLVGPSFQASPGPYRLAFHAQRRAATVWTPPGYVSPGGVRLTVRWLASDCSTLLGEGSATAPEGMPLWEWVVVSSTVEAPAGTACARLVLEVEPLPRGLGVDSLELLAL